MPDASDLLERISEQLPAPRFDALVRRRARKLRRQRTTARTVALVLTALLFGAVFVVRSSSERRAVAPGEPEPSGRIAFTVREGNGWHVATANADGSERRILTGGVRDYATSWSPDGSRIAFDRDAEDGGGIWVMEADGTNLRQITEGSDMFPRWSPDGTQIVFARYGDGMFPADEFTKYATSHLWVVDADGTNERQLTDGKVGDTPGTWAPGGDGISFLRSSEDGSGIWTIRPDGSQPEELVHFELQLDGTPAWSPDGSRLLYPHNDGIWVVEADGTDARRFIESATDPTWSPDGSWIAFSRGGDIWAVRSDGSDERRVTSGPDEEIQPTWGQTDDSGSPEDDSSLSGAELAQALGLEPHSWSIGTTIEATQQGVVLDGVIPPDCAASFSGEVVIVQQVGDGTFYCAHGETYADAWAVGQALLGSIPTRQQVLALDTGARPPIGGMPEDVDGDGLVSDRGRERIPQLIRAVGDSGVAGYLRFEDSEGPQPSNPRDAVSMNERPWIVPIYADDGATIVDRIGGSP